MSQIKAKDGTILGTLCLLMFAVSSQVMAVAPLLGPISAELSVETAVLGNLMTVYAAMVGVFALVAGPISDRIGRRKILLFGSCLMGLALALHGVSWNFASLLVFRTLAGVAGGVLSGALVAFAGDYFPAERRGWANGWIMSGMAAGQIVGVPFATLIGSMFGYKIPFVFFALVTGVCTLCVWAFIPQLATSNEPLTMRRVFRVYGGLISTRSTIAAMLTCLGLFFGIASLMAYLPTWLEGSLGFSTAMIAMLYFVGGAGTVFAGPRAGSLSDRVGRIRIVGWATVGFFVFVLLLPMAAAETPLFLFPVFLCINVFLASRAAAFQALLSEMVDTVERGSFMSLTAATGQVGFAAGAAIAGPTFVSFGFLGNVVLAAVSSMAAAGLAWKFIPDPGSGYAHREGKCPCNQLQLQSGLCGPTPESGHMANTLQPRAGETLQGAH